MEGKAFHETGRKRVLSRRAGGALCCVGVASLVVGAMAIAATNMVLRETVKEVVRIRTQEELEDRVNKADEDYDVYVWNITNLAEVMESGAKPRLEEIKFPLKDKEINFDRRFLSDHEEFEYKSWWTYLAKDEETARRMNESTIVQVNPVYLGAIAEYGQSEEDLFVNLAYLALDAVVQILEGTVDVLKPLYVDSFEATFGYEPDVESTEYVQFATGTNLTSWDQVVAAQWGQGTLTQSFFGLDSVLPVVGVDTVLVAPELFGAYGETMAVEDAVQFLRTFTQPNSFYELSVEEQLAYPGVTASNLGTILSYYYSYITETMFLKGYVVGYYRVEGTETSDPRGETSLYLVDGLGRHNSGLFTRRSASEMLFGYHDVIFDLIPADSVSSPLSYDGVLGPVFADPEAQAAANSPLIYRELTGKRTYNKVRQYTLWRNTTSVLNRDELPPKVGEPWTCATWEIQGYESCRIFLEPVEMTRVYKEQIPPFKKRKNFKVWAPEVLRSVRLTFDREATTRGIRGRKYVVHDSSLVTGDCEVEEPCNPENLRYRMTGPSYHAPMYTASGGTPVSFSRPALGQMQSKWRDLFDGLPDYDQAKHEVYVVVEPVTGFFIEGKNRLQYNFDLFQSALPTWPIFTHSDTLYFPYLWFDENDKISRGSARAFKRVFYGMRTSGIVITVCFLFIGLLCILAAVLFCCTGTRPAFLESQVDSPRDDSEHPLSVIEMEEAKVALN